LETHYPRNCRPKPVKKLAASVDCGAWSKAEQIQNMPTDKAVPARRGNPNWVKGVSGNPGGRPRAIVEVQELAQAETAASIAALVRVRDCADTPPVAVVAAATALLDRGWGRPAQAVAAEVNVRGNFVVRAPPAVETTEQWLAIYAPKTIDAEPAD
jgi:hypothetical protein